MPQIHSIKTKFRLRLYKTIVNKIIIERRMLLQMSYSATGGLHVINSHSNRYILIYITCDWLK